jgi:phosphoglycerate dehydrogenase-like enzyme
LKKTPLVIASLVRPLIEPRLPEWVEPYWFSSSEEALALAERAEIGWFDMYDKEVMAQVITAANSMKWLNSIYAGVDHLPIEVLRARGTMITNGAGINAITIAEYVIMGMLTVAKGYADVVRAADRQQWLMDSPGKAELFGSSALVLGYGAIGKLVEERLRGFGVDVSVVRRSPSPNTLSPDEWRKRLGEFDWVILAVPATSDTDGMIGTAELAAMKPTATLINIARGSVIDQEALENALRDKHIGAAFLDVTTPEPLPADHPLWRMENCHISMHLSGRAQDKMFARSADRFIENLHRWQQGVMLEPLVDFDRGY